MLKVRSRHTSIVIVAMLLGPGVSPNWADTIVEFAPYPSTNFSEIVTPRPVAGSAIVIPLQSQGGTYRVRASDVSESIGAITFTSGGILNVGDLIVASASVVMVDRENDFPTPACSNWGGFNQGAGHRVQVQAMISGNITGPVTASKIARLRAGGDIIGAITQTENAAALVSIECGGAITGPITAPAKIDRIKATALRANVSASGANNFTGDYYAIGTVEMTEDIGTPSTPVSITTDSGPFHNLSTGYDNGAIRKIVARNIYANITTPRPVSPPPYSATNRRGDIVELITNPGDLPGHGAGGTRRPVDSELTLSRATGSLL